MMLRPLVFLLALALPAWADPPPLFAKLEAISPATLRAEDSWSMSVTFKADGLVTAKRCKGYKTENPTCRIGQARAPTGSLEAVRFFARTRGLAEHSSEGSERSTDVEGTISATLKMDGQTVEVATKLFRPDAEPDPVKELIAMIGIMIPAELAPILGPS